MRKTFFTSLLTFVTFWMVAMTVQAQSVVTEIKDGAKVYIRYKSGSQYYYWNAAGMYGTTAVTDVHGVECTLHATGDGSTYYLHLGIANGGGISANERYIFYQGNRFKCDKGKDTQKTAFSFVPVSGNSYKIKFGSNFVAAAESPLAGAHLTQGSRNNTWEVVTKEQLLNEMAAASSTTPVDATFFVSDPGFGRNILETTKNNWEVYNAANNSPIGNLSNSTARKVGSIEISNSYGNDEIHGKESVLKISGSGSLYKVQQKITGLPNGRYRVSAQGAAKADNACYLFAVDGYSELKSDAFRVDAGVTNYTSAYNAFTGSNASSYTRSIEVYVIDGTLTIGVENKSTTIEADAFIDNFELYYLSTSAVTTYNATATKYTPEAVNNSSWIEVKATSSDILNNPEKYFFTIWSDANTLFGMKDGEDGMQGTGYKTMGCYRDVNPLDSLGYVWEMYRIGTSGRNYVFINPTSREDMLQTETEDTRYFRFNSATVLNTNSAKVTLTASRSNDNWTLKTSNGKYLQLWRPGLLDVAAGTNQSYYKIYAIPRKTYVLDPEVKRITDLLAYTTTNVNSTIDITPMLANPDASGTNGTDVFGWTTSANGSTTYQTITNSKNGEPYDGFSGKSCFKVVSSNNGADIKQTFEHMPKGVYTIKVSSAVTGAGYVYIRDAKKDKPLDGNTTQWDIVCYKKMSIGLNVFSREITEDDATIEIGVHWTGPTSGYIFDDFSLSYSLTSINATDDFFIRKNFGTVDSPKYHYVNAGGTDGKTAVLSKHGMEFTFVDNGDLSKIPEFSGLQPRIVKTPLQNNGSLGYLSNTSSNTSLLECAVNSARQMLFKPVDPTTKPYTHYIYTSPTGASMVNVDASQRYVNGTSGVNDALNFSGQPCEFEVVSRDQLVRELSYANATNPVDATFFIKDADFTKDHVNTSAWKIVYGNGSETSLSQSQVSLGNNTTLIQKSGSENNYNNFVRAVVYTNGVDYSVQQTLTGLPNGYYRLSAQGIGGQPNDKTHNALYLFANNGTTIEEVAFDTYSVTAATSLDVIANYFAENNHEKYKKYVDVKVIDGTLIIGARCGEKKNATSFFDNFELYYLGEDTKTYNDSPVRFDVTALKNIVEVKTPDDDPMIHPENYFFTIWENGNTCLSLADGTENYQGEGYKTMSFVKNPNLVTDLSCLWEFYKTADGKYVITNAADRENMMQMDGTNYFRYNASMPLNVANASVEFQTAILNNWIICPSQGYLHRWNKDYADIIVDNNVGYHKIYAIPRNYYVMDVQKVKYVASKAKPQDVSLLLSNPDGMGTSEDKTSMLAWNTSNVGNVWTKEGTGFDAKNGKSYFEHNNAVAVKMSQTVSGLLRGTYKLSVSRKNPTASKLFVTVKSNNKTTTLALNNNAISGGVAELEFSCGMNDTIMYGVDMTSRVDDKFDNFKLTYCGDPDTLYAEPLEVGKSYYIRTLNSNGEYCYLQAGSSYGTSAIFVKDRGIDYGLDDASGTYTYNGTNAAPGVYPLYYLHSGIVGGRGQHLATSNADGTGGLFNDSGTMPWCIIPRGDEYPFQYLLYFGNSGKFAKYDQSIKSGPNMVLTDDDNAYFEIVPKSVRILELGKATSKNPMDATFLITDPNFNKSDIRISAWKCGADDESMAMTGTTKNVGNVNYLNNGSGEHCNMMVSSKDGVKDDVSYNFYQTLTDIPNGHYIISVSGVATKAEAVKMSVTDGTNLLAQVIFGDTDVDGNYKNVTLNSNNDAVNNFFNNSDRKSLFRHTIEVDVTNETMVIAFNGTASEFRAFFDNIEMTFCGESKPSSATSNPSNFTPASMTTPTWIEVSTTDPDSPLNKNPEDYLFMFWKDKDNCLALASGTDGYQGSSYKTMTYTKVTGQPWDKVEQLWEIYRCNYGVADGNYIISNATNREMMMQGEVATDYFRFRELVDQKNDKAVVTFTGSANYNNWKINSAISGRELGRWDKNKPDVKMLTSNGDYYKIYAIKRIDYYTKKFDILYTANILIPTDVSLLLKNPDAMGEFDTFKHVGWNINTVNEISVSDTVEHKFAGLNGKGYFEYRHSEQPKTKMSQTINNLIRGYYLLGISTTCAGSNAHLYIACNNDTIDEELSSADPITHVVYVPIYVDKNGSSIEVGINLSGYKHKKNSEDDDDTNASYIVKFDHFTLQYMGVSEVLASALADGTYFIRTNKNYGTDMSPEYMYLEAGGNRWGTDPILSKHGFAMELTKLNDGKYSIKNPLYQSGGGHGSMFDGLHFDHSESQFTFQKVHPDDEESYEYWMYSHKASTNISGSNQTGLKGYMIKDNDNSLSLLDVSSAPTGEESAIWEIVTKTQRIKELQDATYENPMDATFFITDPSFGRNNTGKTSWLFNGNSLPITLGNNDHNSNNKDYDNLNISIGSENPSGDTKSNKYDFNVKIRGTSTTKSTYNLTQKVNIDNLPAGLYRLSVHGYTNTDGGAILYAANEYGDLELCELNKVNGYADAKETDDKIKEHRYAAYWFTGNKTMAEIDKLSTSALNAHKPGEFKKEIEFKVLSNTIIIGVRGELESEDFAMIDNFELYYLGEAAQDLSKLSEPVERYIYNVDAGKYLNDENGLSQLKQLGKKYFIEPVTGKTDRFYIYTKDINDKKSYISPFREADAISYVKPNDTKAYEWIIKKASTSAEHNYIYEISDNKGRLFESTGDAANVAYLGFANDKEPRCTRWSFYEAGQYQKDRVFTTLASATRTDMWRVLRAAKVNHRDLSGGYAVAGLEEAMDRLDAVWTSPMASKLILEQKVSDMKNLMIASTTTRGSEKMPLDVSFYIQNAGLGDKIGWSNYDAWKITTGQNQSYGSNAVERIVSIEKFLYGENNNVTLTQIIRNVPAGKYKLAVDLRTRGSGSYRLFMNADGAEPVELSADNYSNATINTFITDNYIELDKTQDLTIGIQQTRGSVAFDNFKLYFCGNVSGKLKLNGDSTELTILGDWDRMEDLTNSVNKLISKTKESLGVVYAYKSDFILSDNLNVTAVGWQGGDDSRNNVLFYTDYDGVYNANDGDKSNYKITGASNIVRKNSDGSYTCDNLVITDRMTMHVPYEFTAASVSYSRSNKISTGTLCLPLDLTKMPSGINKFYMPEKIDWDENPKYGKLKLVEYTGEDGKVLPANTPVLYNGVENGTITVNESNALVHRTSELRSPKPEEDDLSIYGTYKYKYVIGKTGVAVDGTKNSDGLSADVCYYVKTDNNSLVRGNHWFNIGAFRAFVYRGKGELNNVRPSVLYVDFDDVFDAVNEIAVDDAVVVGYYDVKGVCYDKPQKGLNIILYSDGTRHKIYVK